MPDWSYHTIFKPILHQFSSTISREFIHRGMSTIASLPFGAKFIDFLGRHESSPQLEQQFDGNTLVNPIGISGEIDPLLSGTKAFTKLGFGFIEIGPITLEAKEATGAPVSNAANQEVIFPLDQGSVGVQTAVAKLKSLRTEQPVFVRLKGQQDEVQSLIESLDTYAAGFIIDSTITSTNLNTTKPIYRSISVLELGEEVPFDCAGIVLDFDIDKKEAVIAKIRELRKHGYSKTLLTTGGITEPIDALDILDSGANAVMVSGGYVFSGPGLTNRINEALLDQRGIQTTTQVGWFAYWLFGLFILIGGLIALIFSITSVILPYDEWFLGMQKETIIGFNRRIILFMAHDRMTLAGTMISGGIMYMSLAKYGVRVGLKWAKQATDTAAILGFFGIFLFIGFGYFDWLHLLFWLVLLPFYLKGFFSTRGISGTPRSSNRRNHSSWKRAVWGQLLFVILGFSFVLGGIIISIYGVTTVFVPSDLLYICMSPEQLQAFNARLIPVIAHDRAGFGSALLSVGLLVLMLSLWGFQQGQKWMWWTYLIGGLPAFITAISIHVAIGYTTFIHLAPAYFAVLLYIGGLTLTYPHFHKTKDQ